MKTKRRTFNGEFKARVVLESLPEKESMKEICDKYEIHPNLLNNWRKEFLEKAHTIFEHPLAPEAEAPNVLELEKVTERLYSKIGKLEMELEYRNNMSAN